MEQLGFEGMPRRLYACTPTRLSTWLDCPRRYRMSYLDRPAPPKGAPWAHNSLGASVHNALAGWWRLPRRERTVAAAGDLLEDGWLSDGFADAAQSAAHRQRSRQLVEEYVTDLDPAVEPAGVERTVATRTDLIAVSGRIDRLDDRRPMTRDRASGSRVTWSSSTTRPAGNGSRSTTRGLRWRWRSTRSPPSACSGVRAARSSCIICRPAACWPGSIRPRHWTASSGGPRRSRRSARTPTSATRRLRPVARRLRMSSRHGPARAAAGATFARTAPRAAPPRRRGGRGTVSA